METIKVISEILKPLSNMAKIIIKGRKLEKEAYKRIFLLLTVILMFPGIVISSLNNEELFSYYIRGSVIVVLICLFFVYKMIAKRHFVGIDIWAGDIE